MKHAKRVSIGIISCLLFPNSLPAENIYEENAFQRAGNKIEYDVEFKSTFSGTNTPLWLNANTYGLTGVEGGNGYFRTGIFRDADIDSAYNCRIGFGVDLAVSYNFTNVFTVQQFYADIDYKKVRFTLGSKQHPMHLKNQRLSSGSQTFGINSRPIPDVRIELPDYVSITGKSNWLGIKGHFGYGVMTDGVWQQNYVKIDYNIDKPHHYAKQALYHSKSGFLRIGNEEKFPLVFEGGIEMACQFGGKIYNPIGSDLPMIEMGHGVKDFFKAIYGGGSDATDDVYANASGNTLGSWLFSLSYKGKDWKVRAYYDHFFEDHSQMFFEYGWLDGMYGVELTLPKNRIVKELVYEYLNTTYQSGPVYHDHTSTIPDQISGVDNYYNHNLYQGWQHWGQAIGNPLYHSPLYRNDGTLFFAGNRFRAHHIGMSGNPLIGLDYRILYSYMKNWGRYAAPYLDTKYSHSFLAEVNYNLPRFKKINLEGWSLSAGFALDRGKEIGDNTGAQITIRKSGLLTK